MSLGPNPHKLVNGVKVLLTPEEIAEREAEIAAEAAIKRVPGSITPLQARRIVRARGLKPALDAWLSSQPEEVNEAWQYAKTIERNSAFVIAFQAAAGLTDDQVDDVFIEASALT